ncbi:MAG: DUF393 domain-containing protein [Phycisphaerales bacterium]|nr:DUF393 domain-containing protein [Phycisphaerales bacterium]
MGEPTIILFDGACNLCNGVVAFVIPRDPAGRFRFAPLQSHAAAAALAGVGLMPLAPGAEPDSMVVIAQGRALERSDAALAVARGLPWPWRWLAVLGLLPRPVRDGAYRFIARRRYRWFGRRPACMVPTPGARARFLEGSDAPPPSPPPSPGAASSP